jgi:hypothetical protein
MSSYFYTMLTENGKGYDYDAVSKWTETSDVIGCEKIIVTPPPHTHARARAHTGTHTGLCMLRVSKGVDHPFVPIAATRVRVFARYR